MSAVGTASLILSTLTHLFVFFFFLIYTRCIICVVTAVSSLSAVLVFFWSLNLKGSGHILEVVL